MDVPSPAGRHDRRAQVKVGDKVSEGAPDPAAGSRGCGRRRPPKETVTRGRRARRRAPASRATARRAGVYEAIEVKVPDIGDFKDVPVIEVHVKPGDGDQGGRPADHARVRQGDDGGARAGGRHRRRGEGQDRRPRVRGRHDPALRRDRRRRQPAQAPLAQHRPRRRQAARRRARAISTPRCWCSAPVPAATPPRSAPPISARTSCWSNAAPTLGGVCLNVGCIPSKALLHAAKVIDERQGDGPRTA